MIQLPSGEWLSCRIGDLPAMTVGTSPARGCDPQRESQEDPLLENELNKQCLRHSIGELLQNSGCSKGKTTVSFLNNLFLSNSQGRRAWLSLVASESVQLMGVIQPGTSELPSAS